MAQHRPRALRTRRLFFHSIVRPRLKIARNGDEVDIQYELHQVQPPDRALGERTTHGLTSSVPRCGGVLCRPQALGAVKDTYTKISPGMMKSMRVRPCITASFSRFPSTSAIRLRWHDNHPIVGVKALPTRSRASSASSFPSRPQWRGFKTSRRSPSISSASVANLFVAFQMAWLGNTFCLFRECGT